MIFNLKKHGYRYREYLQRSSVASKQHSHSRNIAFVFFALFFEFFGDNSHSSKIQRMAGDVINSIDLHRKKK